MFKLSNFYKTKRPINQKWYGQKTILSIRKFECLYYCFRELTLAIVIPIFFKS